MVFISKNDKKTWQDYIDNFEHFTLNLKKDDLKKEVKIEEKNSIKKNDFEKYEIKKKYEKLVFVWRKYMTDKQEKTTNTKTMY